MLILLPFWEGRDAPPETTIRTVKAIGPLTCYSLKVQLVSPSKVSRDLKTDFGKTDSSFGPAEAQKVTKSSSFCKTLGQSLFGSAQRHGNNLGGICVNVGKTMLILSMYQANSPLFKTEGTKIKAGKVIVGIYRDNQ